MQTCDACGSALPEGARFCPSCGATVAEAAPTSDERKLATVLFADLVGSTALADDEDPERVRLQLDRFYDAMSEEIERTGGTLEKFAGDAVMAVFGAPTALEDHAERALHAALAMQDRLPQLDERLSVRIGINTGEVVVGRGREGSSFVTGDAVNVAARLEQAAEAGEILAGVRTVGAAGAAFEFGPSREVDAKGKSAPVAARPVVRAVSLVRPRGAGELQRVFVGRETELELLGAAYRRAVASGEPHLVTIVGEPGVGKTTLVRELWADLAQEEAQPVRRTGRCLPYGDGITYWPLGEILKEHFEILDSDAPERILARLSGRAILGLALGLDVAGNLHPIDAREQLHAEVVGLVEFLAAEAPLVLLVEDVHWAEDDLLVLLERIVRDVRAPLVLVTTARPELFDRRMDWGSGRRNTATIWLEPLPPDSTSLMLSGLLSTELPDQLRELVVARAEGNPFFVEELVRALVEAGTLERQEGWVVSKVPDGFSVPDSVHAVLAARMDRLAPIDKAGLQAAAVVGRTFWHGPVVHLLDGEPPDFGLLEERDFIRRQAGSSLAGETEYAMKHALTRDVAYSSIPKARRGRLHAAFATWMVENDRAKDEHASLLAYHFAEAVRPEDADLAWSNEPAELERLRSEAVRWLRRAADLASGRYEIDEAIELFSRAIELVDDSTERSALWREVGLCNALKFDGEAFWTAMQNSLETCPDRATCADTYSLLAFHTASRSGMWRQRPDREVLDQWIERTLELSERDSPARARGLVARCHARGNGDVATVAAEASAIAERLGDPELRSYAWGARAQAAFDGQRYEEAFAHVERRFELVDDITDPDHLAELYGESMPLVAAAGRLHEARENAERGEAINSRLTPHHRVHGVSYLLELEELLGDWTRIAELRERTERAVDENLDTPCIRNMRSLLLCAVASLEFGRRRESQKLEARAEDLGMTGHDPALSAPRTRLALIRGDGERVREIMSLPYVASAAWYGVAYTATRLDAFAATRDARVETEAPLYLQPRSYFEPFALRALAMIRQDDELLARADERFRALGLQWHAAQTERLLAGI